LIFSGYAIGDVILSILAKMGILIVDFEIVVDRRATPSFWEMAYPEKRRINTGIAEDFH
jgi:hypothetical protein